MTERYLTDEQRDVLHANFEIAETTGLLKTYSAYHELKPDTFIAFRGTIAFNGLSLVVGQVDNLSGRRRNGTFAPIGNVDAEFDMHMGPFFTSDHLLVAGERLYAELGVGLKYGPTTRRRFLEKWLWLHGVAVQPYVENKGKNK